MEKITFSDINKEIDNLFKNSSEFIFSVNSQTSFTPQISELKIESTNKNICQLDDRNKIRNLFIYHSFPKGYEIDESLFMSISNFMLGTNIPEEEKKILSEYLSSDIKQYIFKDFFERAKETDKSFYIDGIDFNDYGDEVKWYNPKINGIPLKDYIGGKIDIRDDVLYKLLNESKLPDTTKEIVILNSFLESYNLFDMQWCPENIQSLKEQLEDTKIKKDIDDYTENLDKDKIKFLKSVQNVEHNVKMNEKLKEGIINGIPQDFNQMEKTMYLYIKLCQTFSYDDVFYFNNKTKNHGELSKISEYDENNNKIVCYEFAYMYSELLKEIGIEHIRENKPDEDRFSGSHANIEFLVDDFALFADSTITVEEGDLINAKSYGRLNGFRCQLYDENKQKDFRTSLEKVYSYIKEKDEQRKMFPQKNDIKDLDTIEKLKLFNQYIENCEFKDIDLLSYIQKLKVTMFKEDGVKIQFANDLSCDVSLTGNSIITDDIANIRYKIDMESGQAHSYSVNKKSNKNSSIENDLNEEKLRQEKIERIFGKEEIIQSVIDKQQLIKQQEAKIAELKKTRDK